MDKMQSVYLSTFRCNESLEYIDFRCRPSNIASILSHRARMRFPSTCTGRCLNARLGHFMELIHD